VCVCRTARLGGLERKIVACIELLQVFATVGSSQKYVQVQHLKLRPLTAHAFPPGAPSEVVPDCARSSQALPGRPSSSDSDGPR
jgi:hypothetical protein